ncbi:uncharacterized protein LOC128311604 isoform X3 [Acinonyx jubatus]|uniref:Uncharacterized protein LOC128311604 isoform X3 n=1 Tax=Acinonyx jubatus TaxID=32536 RepID=A0ABM3NG22_ACIJB|nr:uncharacterized protein LOC128311604 isoform X3 [Acinonyx jubatus]
MGQSQSTPLSLLVANFRDVKTRGQNLSLDIRRGKLITLCRSEWPTFGVGWPTEGTFCLPIIAKPTWDDCQQLLRILFTTEERERIQLEARNLVPGDDRRPTSNPDLINAAFPLTRPPQDEWDYNTAEALQRVHEDVWPKLKELYETGPPPIPHQFRPGDWVLVKRHRQGTLEPRWKGPFQVILTTPTAIKVDGIATWIHFAHAKPVDPFSDLMGPSKTTWTVDRTKDNPLKLTLRRQRTEP